MAAQTYDAKVDAVLGDKLMLFLETTPAGEEGEPPAEYTPVAFGTTCSIDISGDTIETSSKMSGAWKEFLVGQSGYTVSCESLLSKKEGHVSFTSLKKMMTDRKPIAFVLGSPADDENFTKEQEFVKGYAIITALNMTANNGEICTCSVTLQGTGALEDAAA